MPPRRSHRKSRLGCVECKRRKIKCDEGPPPCANCRKHNIECHYAPPPASDSTAARKVSGQPGQSRSRCAHLSTPVTNSAKYPGYASSIHVASGVTPNVDQQDIFSTFGNANIQFRSDLHLHDLELMHHYTTQTYQTLSNNNEHGDIWRDVIPKEALHHPYLMHGLLALAALHLIHCGSDEGEPRRRYSELATMHQDLAIAAFRPVLSNITPSNCNAVFAFSTLIAALAFTFSRTVGSAHPGGAVEEVLQDLSLFRGVGGVLETSYETIEKGPLGPLVLPPEPFSSQPISPDTTKALDYLRECNDNSASQIDADEKDAYSHAIDELRITFERSASTWSTVFRWPILISDAYLTSLKKRRPMALVILAHYCVILRRMDSCWWSKGWSQHLFEAIYLLLDVNWRPLIHWPLQIMRSSNRSIDVS